MKIEWSKNKNSISTPMPNVNIICVKWNIFNNNNGNLMKCNAVYLNDNTSEYISKTGNKHIVYAQCVHIHKPSQPRNK